MTRVLDDHHSPNVRSVPWNESSTAVLERSRDEDTTIYTLLQTATAFIENARAVDAQVPDMPRDPAPTLLASSQLLVQLAGKMLDTTRVGMAHFTGKAGIFRPLADIGLISAERWHWWADVQGAPIGAAFPRADRKRLHSGQVLVRDATWQKGNEPSQSVILVAPIQVGKTLFGILASELDCTALSLMDAVVLVQAMAKFAAQSLQGEKIVYEWSKLLHKVRMSESENAQMSNVLSQTCHELKAPLTTMKVSVQLAERQLRQLRQSTDATMSLVDSLAKLHELLNVTNRQISMEDQLINDLLDVTRIQSGKMEMHPTLCNLPGLIAEAVQAQQIAWPNREFHLDLPRENLLAAVDPHRVMQVIGNYLTNALKYSPADQPIEVRLQSERHQARVSVQDHGVGMQKQATKRIWDSFYRVDGIKALNGTGVNLGIGLFICRTIIQQQHGRVGVKSVPGHGSTFWFTLPLSTP